MYDKAAAAAAAAEEKAGDKLPPFGLKYHLCIRQAERVGELCHCELCIGAIFRLALSSRGQNSDYHL